MVMLAMAALQGRELGDALLHLRQVLRIAVQRSAITVEIPGQILQLRQQIAAAIPQRLQAGIEGLHQLQLLLAGGQML